jgi:hypothetical protein
MDNKTKGLIATIATGVLFGCPGLFLIGFAVIALLPDPANPLPVGGFQTTMVFLVIGIILFIVPIAVGVYTLGNKPETPASAETLPPTS